MKNEWDEELRVRHVPKPEVLEQLARFSQSLQRPMSMVSMIGRVSAVDSVGVVVRGLSKSVKVGEFVRFGSKGYSGLAEVMSLDASTIVVKPMDAEFEIALGSSVEAVGSLEFFPCEAWKGRIISALAEPVDGRGQLVMGVKAVGLSGKPPPAMERSRVEEKLHSGIKVVDIFVPLCYGQRVGIFAGSGVGKSTLLSMFARAPGFDTVVVALVGERGREVTEFVSDVLGEALKKSIIVVATGDESATRRKLTPLLAMSIAEHFRDEGQRVLLVMDSITRFAHALREMALATGEPPVARGYPPSIFGTLPQLLERAGPGRLGGGSITGIFSVLVDGDNHNEPIADAIRGTLDGHIVLDREIAGSGRYPAINIPGSLSRLCHKAWSSDEMKVALNLRKLVGLYEDSKDLRALGGYKTGVDLELDRALAFVPKLYAALSQSGQDQPCADAFATIAKLTQPAAN